ncbi:MAG: M3 family oligoendopeptidase [Planctomycetota bacterium]
MNAVLPHWDLSSIYSGFEGVDYQDATRDFERRLADLEAFFREHHVTRESRAAAGRAGAAPGTAADVLMDALRHLQELERVAHTLNAYTYLRYSVSSGDADALREQSRHEQRWTRLQTMLLQLQGWIGTLEPMLDQLFVEHPALGSYEFLLRHSAREARHLMDEDLEALAAELSVDGARAFSRLQSSVTSQIRVPLERDGKTEELPISMVHNLCFDPDSAVRERAYHAELAGWRSVAPVVAVALNSIKGNARTLARRRRRVDVLDAALSENRIDRPTLEALLGSIQEFFPVFRRYLKSKAKKLGLSTLRWWDLFAPVGAASKHYTWDQAREFICERFERFSPDLHRFAVKAFERRWIDAEPRAGKLGGGFCMPVMGRDESRILVNFDGSMDQLFTLAHELGHAFHNECQRGLDPLLRGSPSTLAETASIFCETLVSEASLETAGPSEALAILEAQISGATQVCLDISCRFRFEREVIDRRAGATLSADELCALMREQQAETYGDAVVADTYHPYMWLWKPHYYSPDSNFYNFPYAFGHLFGLGLYRRYLEDGDSFVPRYRELLRATGSAYAPALARRFGIDITTPSFWRESLKVVESQVDRYEQLGA